MKAIWLSAFVAGLGLIVGSVLAGEVSVSGVHLCCPACAKAVGKALSKVDGVSNAKCDPPARTVTFTAESGDAAKEALAALNKAGFHGSATADGKAVEVADNSGAKAGDKPAKVTLTGVHNCCGQCLKAIQKTVGGVSGVGEVSVAKREITVSNNKADVAEIVKALNDAGFHVRVQKKK